MRLPKRIRVTFILDDLKKSGDYGSCRCCVAATALTRLGYAERIGTPLIGAFGMTDFIGANYDIVARYSQVGDWFNSSNVEDDGPNDINGYSRSLIGKTLVLERRRY